MALHANAYGAVVDVAALTPQYTASGAYSTATRPTQAQVEVFLNQVSAVLNVSLAEAGFTIPVDQEDAVLALDNFAATQATQMCHAANGVNAYAATGQVAIRTVGEQLRLDVANFIRAHALGFELLGATRTRAATAGLACEELEPLFERD